MRVWMAYCNGCRALTTQCRPPGDKDFQKLVRCNLCNRKIDASNGMFRNLTKTITEEKIDLLEVK
jgi:hypothetical protein